MSTVIYVTKLLLFIHNKTLELSLPLFFFCIIPPITEVPNPIVTPVSLQ